MKPLFLDPLPSTRCENETYPNLRVEDDFVEDSVIRAVMLGQNSFVRRRSNINDLALTANDQDFAGLQLSHRSLQSAAMTPYLSDQSRVPHPTFTPLPESNTKAGTAVHRYRWWLPGVSAFFAIGLGAWMLIEPVELPNRAFNTLLDHLVHLPFGLAEAVQSTAASQRSKD